LPRAHLVARRGSAISTVLWMRPGGPASNNGAVAEIDSFLDIVSDEDETGAGLPVHLQDFILQRRFGSWRRARPNGSSISMTCGLSASARAICTAAACRPKAARDGSDALRFQSDHLQRLPHPRVDLGAVELALDAEGDIARDAAPLQQRVGIVTGTTTTTADGAPVTIAPRKRIVPLDAGTSPPKKPQQGRFAGGRTSRR